MSTNNNQLKELGAVWKKTSNAGKNYYSGNFKVNNSTVYFVMFPNDRKTDPKQPDWRIYESNPLTPKAGGGNQQPQQSQESNPAPAAARTGRQPRRQAAAQPQPDSQPEPQGEGTL